MAVCTVCTVRSRANETVILQGAKTSGLDIQKHAKSKDHHSATETCAMKSAGAMVTSGFSRLTDR